MKYRAYLEPIPLKKHCFVIHYKQIPFAADPTEVDWYEL